MKSYFLRLFGFDYERTQQMIDLVVNNGQQPESMRLLSHLFAAKQVWLNRCLGNHQTTIELWPQRTVAELQELSEQINADWMSYIQGLDESDFEKAVHYQNSRGQQFDNRLEDILAHVINHGTHHRAQIGQYLKTRGLELLPVTDYIMYIREL